MAQQQRSSCRTQVSWSQTSCTVLMGECHGAWHSRDLYHLRRLCWDHSALGPPAMAGVRLPCTLSGMGPLEASQHTRPAAYGLLLGHCCLMSCW
jgi:hypothetical protein